MINMYIYSILMFLSFIFCSFISLGLYFKDFCFLLEWLIYGVNSVNLEVMILVDWVSVLFVGVVFLISSMVVLYSYVYMEGEVFIERFVYLVMLFIFSMLLMIMSPNLISILFGWDGLGLVSYCLVIFYQNYSSYNSGMVTVLSNRIGDVGLLMAIGLVVMEGSWNFWVLDISGQLSMFMIVIAAMTKSAQIPFSVWLPMAMAAPTPVSALVHSSTLVTAGIYLMIRFNELLVKSGEMSMILFFFAILTMFMSGAMAIMENDLKKIIALSTLSQLGLMMMILSIGAKLAAFYHLLTHAVFKSMLFMCAGAVIHLMVSNQDIRLLGNMNEVAPFTMMGIYISNMSLCGAPFMAGFYSKDYIMEMVYSLNMNIMMLSMIILSLMFTVMYSVRLYYYMFFGGSKFYSFSFSNESGLMSLSMMVLMVFSIMVGSMLSWMFFMDFYLIYLSLDLKILTLAICFMGLFVSGFILNISVKVKSSPMFKYFLSSMWFLSYLYLWVYSPFNKMGGAMSKFDKSWGEFMYRMTMMSFLSWFKFMFFYKTYMFVFLFVIIYVSLIFLY